MIYIDIACPCISSSIPIESALTSHITHQVPDSEFGLQRLNYVITLG